MHARNATVGALLSLLAACAPPEVKDLEAGVLGEVEERAGMGRHDSRTSTAADSDLPPGVSLEDGLAEDEAVVLALWRSAELQATLAELGFARAELLQAGLFSNPVFSFLFPLGAKQFELAAKLPLEVLWLRPRRVAAAEMDLERVSRGLVQAGLDLVRDTRLAHAAVILASERARLAEEAAKLAGGIAEIAESRLRAGDASELETAAARIDALLAREEAERVGRDLALDQERLRALLSLPRGSALRALPPEPPPPLPPEDSIIEDALLSRPDLRGADLALEAAEERAGLARLDVVRIAAIADANEDRGGPLEIGPGIELPLPIFDRNQGGIARAEAEAELAARRREALRQKIVSEVRQALIRYEKARDESDRWGRRVLPRLDDAVRSAERAFAAGDVSILLVLETTSRLVKGRARRAEADAEAHRARVELDRSVGHRIPSPGAVTRKGEWEKPPGGLR